MAKGSLQREKDRQIEAYLRKGKSYTFIVSKLGVSFSRVAIVKRKAGLMKEEEETKK